MCPSDGSVDIPNDVRPTQHQDFAAVLLSPVIVQSRIADLDVRPHRAVVDDYAFLHDLEKVIQNSR